MSSVQGGIIEYFAADLPLTLTVATGATIAGGDMVALDGDGNAVVAGADSVAAVGVALHNAGEGALVSVANRGVWPLKAAGTVGAGDWVTTAANGDVAALAIDVTSTVNESTVEAAFVDLRSTVGIALEDIASGDTGKVLLRL